MDAVQGVVVCRLDRIDCAVWVHEYAMRRAFSNEGAMALRASWQVARSRSWVTICPGCSASRACGQLHSGGTARGWTRNLGRACKFGGGDEALVLGASV